MPMTPDETPNANEEESNAQSRGRNGAGNGSARPARTARSESITDDVDDTMDDAGDIDIEDGDDLDEAPAGQSFSDLVRASPIGALVGAFIAGFLVARLI